ncbi:MAG TPA: RNA-binding cell elongation regulator Jag/EloR [Fimbriimonadaceae bacterium]|nr:RNA-binding cell elongation regulator Jag/EloR [Fimbriimonadaceae bacterium]
MASIEITAKSVAEATAAAATKLGVPESSVSVTVLEETKGLFGKSTVRVKAEVVEAKAKPAAAEKPKRPSKAAAKAEAEPEPEPEAAPEPKEAEPKKGRRGAKEKAPAAEPEPSEDGAAKEVEVVATEADGAALVGLVHDLMSKAGLEVRAQAKEISGRYVTIELDGQDAAHLVGKQGEVLNATQYLVNIIAGRRFNNGVRATLDGNNYRRRREARLEAMATELAKQVRARGEEAVLDALPAFERRVVHKVLSSIDGITTYSEGEEPNRRVVIAPAD